MKKLRIPFLSNELGVSYAVSAVVITATIVTLVLVASMYAYQVLEQQRGMAEFDCAKESILAFNDALENVAWKPQAARSVRFTIKYGYLDLIPNDHPEALNLTVIASVGNNAMTYSTLTGFIRYSIKNRYVNFGEGYESYILGTDSLIVTNNTESYGRALIEQQSSWVNITLNYRVRAMRTSVINVMEDDQEVRVNYVDIWIIKPMTEYQSLYLGDFDLKAKCVNITTQSDSFDVSSGENCTVRVQLGNKDPNSALISLTTPGKVVFNFIVTEVKVTV